jgi:ribosomal-protein-alanine N-acetyltransferase
MSLLVPAGLAHAELLHALNVRCFERPWSLEAIRQALQQAGGFAWLASMAGEPEGRFAGMALAWAPSEDAELLLLGVTAQARRRGLARALVRAVLQQARALGSRAIYLEVAADNLAAQRLYESEGFDLINRRPRYYSDGRDALVLRCALPPSRSPGLARSGCS